MSRELERRERIRSGKGAGEERRTFLGIHDPSIPVSVAESFAPGPGPGPRLLPASPNPFVHKTRLTFDLGSRGTVAAGIHDVQAGS